MLYLKKLWKNDEKIQQKNQQAGSDQLGLLMLKPQNTVLPISQFSSQILKKILNVDSKFAWECDIFLLTNRLWLVVHSSQVPSIKSCDGLSSWNRIWDSAVYGTSHGSSMSVFSITRQLSQGLMADVPAFIAIHQWEKRNCPETFYLWWYSVMVIRVVEFSSGGVQNQKDFYLRINIPKGNYWILKIGVV